MSEQPKVDWREMKAGMELDRLIAEKLGYFDILVGRSFSWGTRKATQHETGHDLKYHVRDGVIQEPLPEWSTDTDAALTLLTGMFWSLTGTPDKYANTIRYQCQIVEFEPLTTPYRKLIANGDTPALAICKAFLAWKDAQS